MILPKQGYHNRVSDRGTYADSLCFTLFHEISHIVAGDFIASFEADKGVKEKAADNYAKDKLIRSDEYKSINKQKTTLHQQLSGFPVIKGAIRKLWSDESSVIERITEI